MISTFHNKQRLLFKQQGLASPDLDSRLLICHACGLTHEQFILHATQEITSQQQLVLDDYQRRRLKGEPVSRILGKREFWGREFKLGDHTLDPRPDTETLIEAILSHPVLKRGPPQRILDLGTGSGAILLTLLLEWPDARGVGVDKSPEALEIAHGNAVSLGCSDRVSWLEGCWFEPVKGQFDLIVSNPPYIVSNDISGLAVEVAEYDPALALDGGDTGLKAYQDIIKDVVHYLGPNAVVAFELGEGQYADVKSLLMASAANFQPESLACFKDLSGINRCILVESSGGISKT